MVRATRCWRDLTGILKYLLWNAPIINYKFSWNNEKIESLRKEIEIIKKEPSRNYRAQKYNSLNNNNNKKPLLDRINSTVETTLPRIHEVEEKSMKCIQSEQQTENRLRKWIVPEFIEQISGIRTGGLEWREVENFIN